MPEETTKSKKRSRYLDLKSEFGFKKVISLQSSLIRFQTFANAVFGEIPSFSDIQYVPNVYNTPYRNKGMADFDVLCQVYPRTLICAEMAQYRQEGFVDRTLSRYSKLLSYLDYAIEKEQYERVIYINILNFTISDDKSYISLRNIVKKKGPSGVEYLEVLIELPKFNKKSDELETKLDKWLYLFKNMQDLETIPPKFDHKFFRDLFNAARC